MKIERLSGETFMECDSQILIVDIDEWRGARGFIGIESLTSWGNAWAGVVIGVRAGLGSKWNWDESWLAVIDTVKFVSCS